MTNDDISSSVDDSNSVRIVNVATFPLARSNSSIPNVLVHVVATYDRLDRVGAHLFFVPVYVNMHTCACAMPMATPMQIC